MKLLRVWVVRDPQAFGRFEDVVRHIAVPDLFTLCTVEQRVALYTTKDSALRDGVVRFAKQRGEDEADSDYRAGSQTGLDAPEDALELPAGLPAELYATARRAYARSYRRHLAALVLGASTET